MSLIRYQRPESVWSPFERLLSLRDEVNRLFEGSGNREELFRGWSPAVDVHADKDNVYVQAEIPGMKKEDLEINLHEGVLSISGERKSEDNREEDGTFRSERFFGRFHRSISLPTRVDPGKVTAQYKDGLLLVTLPKAEEVKPKQIEIKVG